MNNLLKLLAFVCIALMANASTAQAIRPATVTIDGLIILDNSIPDLASDYVADITNLNITSWQGANTFFQKYLDKTNGRGINISFDLPNRKMYISIDVANQYVVPLSHEPLIVSTFNEFFRAVHEGRI